MHSALSILFPRKQTGSARLPTSDEFIPIQAAAGLSHTLPEASYVINNILTPVVSTVRALEGKGGDYLSQGFFYAVHSLHAEFQYSAIQGAHGRQLRRKTSPGQVVMVAYLTTMLPRSQLTKTQK